MGSDAGFAALLIYSVVCWLLAPSALIALALHGKRRQALIFALTIVIVSLLSGWIRAQSIHQPPLFVGVPLAFLTVALMLVQFALPALVVATLFDQLSDRSWKSWLATHGAARAPEPPRMNYLLSGRGKGLLLLVNAAVVWLLAATRWLVPTGTENYLQLGSLVVALLGIFLLLRPQAA